MNRQILRLSIPNIINNITVPLVGMADLAILGHLESEIYIGAIALGGLIFNFIYAFFSFLRMGTSGFTAQAYGENNKPEMSLIFGRGILFALTGGIVLIVMQIPIELFSFYLMDGSEQVKELAREYYRIRIFAAPAALGILAFSGWFTGMQNARYPLYIAILVNVVNISGNIFFVFGLGLRADGVAYGTLIAMYSGLLFGSFLFLRKYKELIKFWKMNELLSASKLRRFFKVNVDIIIRTLCLIFTFAFFTSRSAGMNDTTLAVNTLLLQFLFLFSYLTDGFAYAAEALVGKYTGAKNLSSLRLAVSNLLRWGVYISVPFAIGYAVFGNKILLLLTDNQKIIEAARPYFFWIVLVPVLTFAAFIWDGIYIGATASSAMRNTLIVSTFLVFLPSYFLFKTALGNHGLWLAMMLFMISRGVMLAFLSGKYIFKKIDSSSHWKKNP